MNYFIKETKKAISQKRMENYLKLAKIVNWGRRVPTKFAELIFGLELL
jgi:hypothetical protein